VLHADDDAQIGDNVTIGHGVICHARTIGDGSLLGNNSTLNDGVVIGKNSLVAAGSVLNENKVYEDNALIRGTPGKALGTVKERHTELMLRAAASYVNRISRYTESGLGYTGQSVT
jgi:carbonic anhydrase/acetyltransferase-like protein (isoleucine patch superfamily)